MNGRSPKTAATKAQDVPSKLVFSGILLSATTFLAGLSNYAFQMIMGRQLEHGEYGLANSALGLAGLLALPLGIASTAITHYIARFNTSGDDARLHGLLAGCRRFLLHLTIWGSVAAVLLVKPLSDFFKFPRSTLMIAVLLVVLATLWGSFYNALCQGMAWFKRFALIAILAAALRLAFGWFATVKWSVAECAVFASAVAVFANLILFFWKNELSTHDKPISPWNREFIQFLIVSAAAIGGGYFFTQGDMLVVQRYFSPADRDAYAAAQKLAGALPLVVYPLLTVLFTSRSGGKAGGALREQFKLLALYALGLAVGGVCLFALKDFCTKLIFGRVVPESAAMIGRLVFTMLCVGLLQAMAYWALASRWLKVASLYGVLGLSYWLLLLWFGNTPERLLGLMPGAAGIGLVIMLTASFVAMKRHAATNDN